MPATDSLPSDPIQILQSTIAQIEGAYAPATIRAYFADVTACITFCDSNNQSTFSANAIITADFIHHTSTPADHQPVSDQQ